MLAKVAVIIPTYNRWPVVKAAIDSVLNQSYTNVECVLVDDGSTDGSFEALHAHYGSKIVLLRNEENREKSYSRNAGVKMTDAEFVCFLDSDDLLLESSIENRMKFFKAGVNVVYGRTESDKKHTTEKLHGRSDTPAYRLTLEDYLRNTSCVHTTGFTVRRSFMLEYGMYNESLTNLEDLELFIRLLCHSEFVFCGQTVSVLRGVASSRARDNWKKIIAQSGKLSEALSTNPTVTKRLGDQLNQMLKRDGEELLRALYRSKRGVDYRSAFMRIRSNGIPVGSFKNIKRFCLSYLWN